MIGWKPDSQCAQFGVKCHIIVRGEQFRRFTDIAVHVSQASGNSAMTFHGKMKAYFIFIVAVLGVVGILLMYVYSENGYHDRAIVALAQNAIAESRTFHYLHTNVGKEYPFDVKGEDIIVFLHMQKTGGTKFGKHLVKNLDIKYPCDCVPKRKRCTCKRPNSEKTWLFSRYSVGWRCGLHADWTELQSCVPNIINKREGKKPTRKFLYITILREPVSRFVSEFHCYQRGATWKNALHMCNGRTPTKEELPPCYTGENWTDVTLPEFLKCSSNLAINRQTRMLADLRLVGCYNRNAISRERREEILLQSAMKNLDSMAYFALMEYQIESQYLFERTFGMEFRQPFVQMSSDETRAGAIVLDSQNITRIRELNHLDIALYSFAEKLFFERLNYFKRKYEEEMLITDS